MKQRFFVGVLALALVKIEEKVCTYRFSFSRSLSFQINTKLIRLDIYDTKRDLLRYNGTVFSIDQCCSNTSYSYAYELLVLCGR